MAFNSVGELLDHDYLSMQDETNQHEVIEVEVTDDNVQFWPVGERPRSYTLIADVYQHENIKDKPGFLYFKSKRTGEKVYSKCKGNTTIRCQSTGSIFSDENIKQFKLWLLHNHKCDHQITP